MVWRAQVVGMAEVEAVMAGAGDMAVAMAGDMAVAVVVAAEDHRRAMAIGPVRRATPTSSGPSLRCVSPCGVACVRGGRWVGVAL